MTPLATSPSYPVAEDLASLTRRLAALPGYTPRDARMMLSKLEPISPPAIADEGADLSALLIEQPAVIQTTPTASVPRGDTPSRISAMVRVAALTMHTYWLSASDIDTCCTWRIIRSTSCRSTAQPR